MSQLSHSEVPWPGKWRTKHHNYFDDYEWVPDLLAIARRPEPRCVLPNEKGELVLDYSGGGK